MAELAELDRMRAMEMVRLEEEFEAKRKLLEEKYSAQETVVSQFALKKSALEGRIAEMDAELEALDEMDKALEGQDRPVPATAKGDGEAAEGEVGEKEAVAPVAAKEVEV